MAYTLEGSTPMRVTSVRATTFACALAGALFAVVATAPASSAAGAVITVGSLGGTAAGADDHFVATLVTGTKATFFSGMSTGVSCSSSTVTGTLTSNPSAPGDASGTVDAVSFGNCTSNVVGVTGVNGISVAGLPLPFSVDSDTMVAIGGTVDVAVILGTVLGPTTCDYTGGPLIGSFNNADSTVHFTGQHFSKSSGSSLCMTDSSWSATYVVRDSTAGGLPVFVN